MEWILETRAVPGTGSWSRWFSLLQGVSAPAQKIVKGHTAM